MTNKDKPTIKELICYKAIKIWSNKHACLYLSVAVVILLISLPTLLIICFFHPTFLLSALYSTRIEVLVLTTASLPCLLITVIADNLSKKTREEINKFQEGIEQKLKNAHNQKIREQIKRI